MLFFEWFYARSEKKYIFIYIHVVFYFQEEEKRGQPNYEHLDEDLHVLIMVEDTDDRARLRLTKAVEEMKILMTPPVSHADALFCGVPL